MHLTSDHPFWGVSNGLVRSYPSLRNSLRCDCLVVGGGITGALVGYHLAAAGVDTVVVDRRDIGMGSTSGSTGLLQYEVDVPLRDLREKVGAKAANRSYLLCREAIYKLEALVQKHGIRCGFKLRPSLQVARHRGEVDEMKREFSLRRELGIELEFWGEAELRKHFPFAKPAALFSRDGAQVDPHSMMHGVLLAGMKRGLQVFDRTKVSKFRSTRNGIVASMEGGFNITARRAVVAAGFESGTFLRGKAGQLKSTYALISEPVESLRSWFRQALIWETGIPYLYLRTLPDNRVIVGGEDEPFVNSLRRDKLIQEKTRVLMRKFGRLFPDIRLEVAYAWAGTFGQTKDGLPYIGTHENEPHIYFALGYGGNGITYSLIAAEIIRDDFLGRRNRDLRLFRFDR